MIRRLFVVLFLLAVLAGCAKEPLKQAGIQGEGIVQSVRDLASAYERRDIDGFMDKVSISYPDRENLRKSVDSVFSTYQTIKFSVQYSRMLIMVQQKGDIKAVFTWEGEWQTSGGKIVKDGARGTLAFDPQAFKLMGVEGKNPFVPVEQQLPQRQ